MNKMEDLKGKTIEDILSDSVLKRKLKKIYLKELTSFIKSRNQDPYNKGFLCTDVIQEIHKDSPVGLQCLTSFIEVVIDLANFDRWDELEELSKPIEF